MSARKRPGKPRTAAAERRKTSGAAEEGERFQAVIDRVRRWAADAVFGPTCAGVEPPPLEHDDADLMELCSTILHLHRQEREAWNQARTIVAEGDGELICSKRKFEERQSRLSPVIPEAQKLSRTVATLSKRASKLSATTPEGIFAKALIVRSSRTGATVLAMSLARDLIEAPRLRAILWPAQPL